MMKRWEVLKKIAKAAEEHQVAWKLDYQGANHTIYLLGGKRVPIERHAEIDDRLAESIFKECEEILGRRWWR